MPGRLIIKRRSKFGNVRVHGFASKREHARYQVLLALQQAGKIKDLRRQVKFECEVNGVHVCNYIADFTYVELTAQGWRGVVEDCKGFRTQLYAVKKKLVRACFGLEIRET